MSLAAWHQDAACRGTDPDLFFEVGAKQRYTTAKRICAVCPVRIDCLASCMEEESRNQAGRYGFRAGLSPTQREQLARSWRTRRLALRRTA